MSKRLLLGLLLLANLSTASTQPHLFIGGMVGSSLTSIRPEKTTSTPTTLATILGATVGAPDPIQLESSDVSLQNFIFSPSVGMTFPIADFFILEGGVSLDLRKNEYTVSNNSRSNQILASIDRQIGISASAQIRISKQYSIGPMFTATIARNKSEMYGSSALEKEHNIYSYGFQSTYEVNNSFSLAVQCISTLDQQLKLESPSSAAQNLNLDYIDAKLLISARFMPI